MKMRNKRGITLVALVITVIILLILAGITISLTIGQKGILNRAEEAGKNYIKSAQEEEEDLKELYSKILVAGQDDAVIENISVKELKELIKEEVQKAMEEHDDAKTITYNPEEVIELDPSVKSISGTIKRTGNVVHMNLSVYYNTGIQADTRFEVGKLKDTSLIPTYGLYGNDVNATFSGWSYLASNGKISGCTGGKNGNPQQIVVLNYILE